MPKVEIEEADLLANQNLAKAIQAIAANPEARKLLHKAQKIVNPSIPTPSDYQEEVLTEIQKRDEKIVALEKKFDEDKAAREAEAKKREFMSSWEKQKQAVRERFPDLNDTGLSEIEKLATERGIPDYEAAAALYRQLNPPAEVAHPSGLGFNLFDMPEQPGMKDYMETLMKSGGDNDAATNSVIRDTLAELRGQKRAA